MAKNNDRCLIQPRSQARQQYVLCREKITTRKWKERTGSSPGGVAWHSALVAASRPVSGPSPVREKVRLDSDIFLDGLEVAFTLSCSCSDKPMAPRRKCNVCGSQQWHKEPATGLVVCSEGHVLQVRRGIVASPLTPSPPSRR